MRKNFMVSCSTFFTWTVKIKLEKSDKLISADVELCIFQLFLHIPSLAVKTYVRKVNQTTGR